MMRGAPITAVRQVSENVNVLNGDVFFSPWANGVRVYFSTAATGNAYWTGLVDFFADF